MEKVKKALIKVARYMPLLALLAVLAVKLVKPTDDSGGDLIPNEGWT